MNENNVKEEKRQRSMVFCIERVSLSIEDEIPSFVLFCSKDSKVLLVDMLRL
jgi:hypothetical protein